MRRRVTTKCDACRRARALEAVTITFALSFDGHPRMKAYTYLCDECHRIANVYDEMIGPTLQGALCTAIRVMRKGAR